MSASVERAKSAEEKLGESQQVQPKPRLSFPSHHRMMTGAEGEEQLFVQEGEQLVNNFKGAAARDLEKAQSKAEQGSPQEQRGEKVRRSRHRRSVEGLTKGLHGSEGHKERKGGTGEKGSPPADKENRQGDYDLKHAEHEYGGVEILHSSHRRGEKGEHSRRRSSKRRKEHHGDRLAGPGGETGTGLEGEQGSQEAKEPQGGAQQTKRAHRSRSRPSIQSMKAERSDVEGHTGDPGGEKSVKPQGDENAEELEGARDKGADVLQDLASSNRAKVEEARWLKKEGKEHERARQLSHELSAKGKGAPSQKEEEITDELPGRASGTARVQESPVGEASLRSAPFLTRSVQGRLSMSPKGLSFSSSRLESKSSLSAGLPLLKPSSQLIEGSLRHLSASPIVVSPPSSVVESRTASPDSPTLGPLIQQADGNPSVFSDKRASVHIHEISPLATPTRSSSNVLGEWSGNLATLHGTKNGSPGSPQAREQLSMHVPERSSTFVASEGGVRMKSAFPQMESSGISQRLTNGKVPLRLLPSHRDFEALSAKQQPRATIGMNSADAEDSPSLRGKGSKNGKADMPSLFGPAHLDLEERGFSFMGEIAEEGKEAQATADLPVELLPQDEGNEANVLVAQSSASMLAKNSSSPFAREHSDAQEALGTGFVADPVNDKGRRSTEQLSNSTKSAHSKNNKSLKSSSHSFAMLLGEKAGASSEQVTGAPPELPKSNSSFIAPRPSSDQIKSETGFIEDHVSDKGRQSTEQLSESRKEAHSGDHKSLRSSSHLFGKLLEAAGASSERVIGASGSMEAPGKLSTGKPVPASSRQSTREPGFPSPPIGRGASRQVQSENAT
ncbi:hypothetical protein ACSSS7_006283 [Eimeria intestinalis]